MAYRLAENEAKTRKLEETIKRLEEKNKRLEEMLAVAQRRANLKKAAAGG